MSHKGSCQYWQRHDNGSLAVKEVQRKSEGREGDVGVSRDWVMDEKKPVPAREPLPTGEGFWRVGIFQPSPTPAATHTANLHGSPDLWWTLCTINPW
jgi:hypothetical protein